MLPQGLPRNSRELPISSHTKRNASGPGREVSEPQGSTGGGHGRTAETVLQPHTTEEGGEPQGFRMGDRVARPHYWGPAP
jgi:hypothetical protein